jgi:hypothetical protein
LAWTASARRTKIYDFCPDFNKILPFSQDWEKGIKGVKPRSTRSGKYPKEGIGKLHIKPLTTNLLDYANHILNIKTI